MAFPQTDLVAKTDSPLPIVWVMRGRAWYLPFAVLQAQKRAPHNPQWILSDHRVHLGNAKWADMNLYWRRAQEFERVYIHMSSLPFEFEIACMQRWMVLAEWMRAQNIARCLCVDCDILLFCDPDTDSARFREFDLTYMPTEAQLNGYINNLETLERFCDWMIALYRDQPERLQNWFANYNGAGGITDMMLFTWFREEEAKRPDGGNYGIFSAVSGASPHRKQHDNSLSLWEGWESQSNRKKIYTRGKKIFAKRLDGEEIELLSVHFHGPHKPLMSAYAQISQLQKYRYLLPALPRIWFSHSPLWRILARFARALKAR